LYEQKSRILKPLPAIVECVTKMSAHADRSSRQIHEPARQCYLGHAACNGTVTQYETRAVPSVPVGYSHLSGLLDLFRSQLSSDVDDTSVTIRLTYVRASSADWGVATVPKYKDGVLACGALADPVQ
jgi:hypothetical protein